MLVLPEVLTLREASNTLNMLEQAMRADDAATITVDASGWFANVDFTMLPPGGVFPDDNANPASQNLFTAIRAATATFQFSFQ